jgi:hypothetical protein
VPLNIFFIFNLFKIFIKGFFFLFLFVIHIHFNSELTENRRINKKCDAFRVIFDPKEEHLIIANGVKTGAISTYKWSKEKSIISFRFFHHVILLSFHFSLLFCILNFLLKLLKTNITSLGIYLSIKFSCYHIVLLITSIGIYLSREHWHSIGPVQDLVFITDDCFISVGGEGVLVYHSLNSPENNFYSAVGTTIYKIVKDPNRFDCFLLECGGFIKIIQVVNGKAYREEIYHGFGFELTKQMSLCPINGSLVVATYVLYYS